jgi:hypothetical protein
VFEACTPQMTNSLYGTGAFFEKLLVAQLLRKFTAFYRAHRCITVLTKPPPLVHILTQMNLVHIIPFLFL